MVFSWDFKLQNIRIPLDLNPKFANPKICDFWRVFFSSCKQKKKNNSPKSQKPQNPKILKSFAFPLKKKPQNLFWGGNFSHPFPHFNLFPNFFLELPKFSGFALPGGKEDFFKEKKNGKKIPNFCIFPLLRELGIFFYFSQAGS